MPTFTQYFTQLIFIQFSKQILFKNGSKFQTIIQNKIENITCPTGNKFTPRLNKSIIFVWNISGDSFPATGNHLVAISFNEIDEISDDEQELLKRLGQGQARMEQIKRMLVNQRGFIVQALKQMTEFNSDNREVRQKFMDQIKGKYYFLSSHTAWWAGT